MLVDTVVKRDLQLACQNVKDGQPIGSWNFRQCTTWYDTSAMPRFSTRRRKGKLHVLLLAKHTFKEDEVDGVGPIYEAWRRPERP